jgi:hypothetical protein
MERDGLTSERDGGVDEKDEWLSLERLVAKMREIETSG